jgi:hypothetical protein
LGLALDDDANNLTIALEHYLCDSNAFTTQTALEISTLSRFVNAFVNYEAEQG